MALADRDLMAMRIANDPTLPPEERKAKIDELYYDAGPTPAAGPDLRLASNDPTEALKNIGHQLSVPPAPPPTAADVSAPVYATPPAATPSTQFLSGVRFGNEANPRGSVNFGGPVVNPIPTPAQLGAPQTIPAQGDTHGATPGAPAAPGRIKFAGEGGGAGAPDGFHPPAPLGAFGGPGSAVRVGTDTFQPVQRTVQDALPVDEENESAQQTAEREQQSALERQQMAERHAREALPLAEKVIEDKNEIARARYESERQDRVRALEAREKEYAGAVEEQARASSEKPFNSNRFWENKSVGDKIMTGIAVALGQLGAGINPNVKNLAWEKLNQDIANDIEEQRAEHNARVEGAGIKAKLKGTLYDQFRDRGMSDDEAGKAALQAALEARGREIERFKEGLQNPIQQSEADRMLARNQQDILAAQEARRAAHVGHISEVQRWDPQRWVAAGGGVNQSKLLAQEAQDQKNYDAIHGKGAWAKVHGYAQPAGAEDSKLYVPGLGFTRAPREAAALRGAQAEHNAKIEALRKAKEITSQAGTGVGAFGVGTEAYNKAQEQNQILKDLGIHTVDLTKWTGDQSARIDAAIEQENRQFKQQIRSRVVEHEPSDSSGTDSGGGEEEPQKEHH